MKRKTFDKMNIFPFSLWVRSIKTLLYCNYYYYFIGNSTNELPKVINRSHSKRNLNVKIKFLNELSYYLMDCNVINEVSEKIY